MNTIVSSTTGAMYRVAIKPILFRQKPDAVHTHMIASAAHLQQSRLVGSLLAASWAYRDSAALGQTIHGITFENPIGLSAGFDKNFQLPPLLKAIGFGFMEGGSLTYRACAGNPRPWFYRLPRTKSLVVHAGLANEGVGAILARLASYPDGTFDHFPLNISVAKTNSPDACRRLDAIKDYVGSLKAIQAASIGDLITLNISCPNTFGGEPFTTPSNLEQLLAAVDKLQLVQPLFIKMPANLEWQAFNKLLRVATQHRVAGVTISNLTKDRRRAVLLDVLPEQVPGGLSGKPTFELSNELIAKTYRRYGDRLTIIGVGGVFSAEDAYTKIKLGASLVELITGMIFEGPQLIGQINQGLAALIRKDGFSSISQAVGSGNRKGGKTSGTM